jgi:hypothetical protein
MRQGEKNALTKKCTKANKRSIYLTAFRPAKAIFRNSWSDGHSSERKPLSCVMSHDIARYSGGSVLDLFSARCAPHAVHLSDPARTHCAGGDFKKSDDNFCRRSES